MFYGKWKWSNQNVKYGWKFMLGLDQNIIPLTVATKGKYIQLCDILLEKIQVIFGVRVLKKPDLFILYAFIISLFCQASLSCSHLLCWVYHLVCWVSMSSFHLKRKALEVQHGKVYFRGTKK